MQYQLTLRPPPPGTQTGELHPNCILCILCIHYILCHPRICMHQSFHLHSIRFPLRYARGMRR
ncbi:hypothetical protein P170DRAFT_191034 [Aspergillus steynii IBT 23096]|uniref:Uncharacterized protein n=1 Tax=Aspergillus steynii IBT 23096 TaxID=1392250 RepID=A0A2I2G9U0_9EURO|nr:uncharacterized protein P170DRAFT_191034 [Aspergillus steynii IBT 23096]PLB49649.1 hypothetical protein P170DRAFT_191034 [Aspergillus steynii IBT 23096]